VIGCEFQSTNGLALRIFGNVKTSTSRSQGARSRGAGFTVLFARGVSGGLSTGFGMRLAVGTEHPWHCTNLFQIGCKVIVLVYWIDTGPRRLIFWASEGCATMGSKHQASNVLRWSRSLERRSNVRTACDDLKRDVGMEANIVCHAPPRVIAQAFTSGSASAMMQPWLK
jgi:hypothetical protein